MKTLIKTTAIIIVLLTTSYIPDNKAVIEQYRKNNYRMQILIEAQAQISLSEKQKNDSLSATIDSLRVQLRILEDQSKLYQHLYYNQKWED